MAEPLPDPAPAPPPDDSVAPWERTAEKPAGKLPGGIDTGWHDARNKEKDRRKQVAFTVALFFGLAGVLVGLILWLREPTPKIELLAIPVLEYRHIEWASNPTAFRDAKELHQQFEQAGGLASTDQEASNLRTLINRLQTRDDPKTPLLVYVSALAIIRDDKAYILPGDARLALADVSAWIPLQDLLAAMNGCSADQKALLVDLARTPADPFRGPLHDDVAAQIDREIAAFDPQFPILTSCSPGERSLVVPEKGLSVFAYFLAEGLQGEADGYHQNESPDNKVTFAELAGFTIARVSQWADGVPDARQMPKLYGPDGNGFILFRNRTRKSPPDAEAEAVPPPASPPYPDVLRNAWKQRDLHRDLGLMLAPELILELEWLLLQAEERYLAGLDVNDPMSDPSWNTAIGRLERRTRLPRPAKPSSISELRAGRPAPATELGRVLDRWLQLRFPPTDGTGKLLPVNPAELEKLEGEILEKALGTEPLLLDGFAHFWLKLVRDQTPTQEKIANATAILERGRFVDLPLTSELLLLRRLARNRLPSYAYRDAVRSLLEAEQAFGDALAATGGRPPEGFRRIRPLLEAADALQRKAEEDLFKPRINSDVAEAAHQQLKAATEQLKAAKRGAEVSRAAHRAAAEASGHLHATLPGVIAWNDPPFEAWLAVARLNQQLAVRLAADGPFTPLDIEEIDALEKRLRAACAVPPRPGQAEIKKFEEDAQLRPQASTYAKLQRLLAGATLAADERAAIAAGLRKVSAHRFNAIRGKFDKDHIRTPSEHPKWEDPFSRTQRRARASIELIQLAGLGNAEKLDGQWRTADTDLANWQTLGDRLIVAWNREAPAAAIRETETSKWRAVERILRAAPPRLDGFNREVGFGKLFLSAEVERREWLAARFGEYGKLRAGVPGASAFYSELREEYRRPITQGGR